MQQCGALGFAHFANGDRRRAEDRVGRADWRRHCGAAGRAAARAELRDILKLIVSTDAADATLAIRLEASRGTDCTIGYAVCGRWAACADLAPGVAAEPATAHRPVLVVQTLCESAAAPAIREFLHRRRVRTLNVCGHRAYDRVPNYESAVEHLLFRALSEYA